MKYVYYTDDPNLKEDVLEAIALVAKNTKDDTVFSVDKYRGLAYPEFPEVSLYPCKKGDTLLLLGVCHPKRWINHWCARGIKVIIFCNRWEQFPTNKEHQWNGLMKIYLSGSLTLAEMYRRHLVRR